MKIAISQREIILPTADGNRRTFDGLEREWHSFLKGHELIVIANLADIDYLTNLDFDCVVLTGGPDGRERHLTENMLFAVACEREVPILGVCHGAFAINDLTGGVNGQVDGHQYGYHAVVIDDIAYQVNTYHSQSIQRLGEGLISVAHDLDGNVEAFEHESKPIYGIVWHPERMERPVLTDNVRDLLNEA
jgi:putative glutamine amidotransferase